jgi:hypothetical protein
MKVEASNLLVLGTESFEARTQMQNLETHKEVWMSLLKGLPTIIIVTVVAAVTSLVYGGGEGGRIASIAAIMAFICTFALWGLALLFTMRADEKLVPLREKIDLLAKGEDRLRSEAKEMFLRYKSRMMPEQIVNLNQGTLDYGNLSITPGMIVQWRGNFTEERQADMDWINHNLVSEIDGLQSLSLKFVNEFNDFVSTIRNPFLSLTMSGIKDTDKDEARRILAYALFQTLAQGPSGTDLSREYYVEQVARIRTSLAKELHEGSRIFDDVAKIAKIGGVADKARKASIARESVVELYNRIMVEIRYQYSAES